MTAENRNGRICKNCDHFHARQVSYGECRLHPPLFVFYIETTEERGPVFRNPEVGGDDYCGQFTEKPTDYTPPEPTNTR